MLKTELDTFVRKCHQLWNDGVTAHLDLDTHAGDAWVGLRVRLGQVPGTLLCQVHPFHQGVPRKESPSRQRRRARRAAAREANVDRATDQEAVEANKEDVQQSHEEQTVAENAADVALDHAAEVPAVELGGDQIIDEFCSNAEFNQNILSDENSVSYRFILKDISDIEVFKSKVRQSFLATDVNTLKQHFEISGLEKLPDQLKFFLKMIDDRKAIEAIMNLKADENILMMKIPKKKLRNVIQADRTNTLVILCIFRVCKSPLSV